MVDISPDSGHRVKLESASHRFGGNRLAEPTGNHGGAASHRGGGEMSATQTVIGGGIFVTVASALIQLVAPDPAPIVLNSISYESGYVMQDRTVTTSEPFWASWAAQVINADTGEKVVGCFGEGSFAYEPGNKAARLPLQEWVGSDECSLSSGSYYLAAAWYWGDSQLGAKSDVFEVK